MATTAQHSQFHMPTPSPQYAQTSPPNQYQYYANMPTNNINYNQADALVSPINSATATPQNSSPTSPHASFHHNHIAQHSRQLRPQKSPLYVPAVLRPTQPPRRNKFSPPESVNGSFESKGLKRSDTGDSGKGGLAAGLEATKPSGWSVKDLPEVKGEVKRDHWKPDAQATHCDATACQTRFGYFSRRHHCRRCGNIFCDTHSPFLIPLDQNADFHPLGHKSRACEFCAREFATWEVARSSRAGSTVGSEDGEETRTNAVACGGIKDGRLEHLRGPGGLSEMAGSVAASVPRDWNWSTF